MLEGLKVKQKYIAKRIFSRKKAGRNITVLTDDVFIVSYPKSGNTWMRFLIAHLVHENQFVAFHNIDEKIPDIYRNTDSELLLKQRPRILKSHEYFDPRYRKVIYIVRDPRDVLISYYHHHIKFRKIPEGHQLEEFSKRFMAGTIDSFGSWGENVGSWVGARSASSDFLLLRYEDMLLDTHQALRKVAPFITVATCDESIKHAVSLSQAETMRRLEQQQAGQWKEASESRQDKLFVRAAKSGNWQEELPGNVAREIKKKWGGLMDQFGYQ